MQYKCSQKEGLLNGKYKMKEVFYNEFIYCQTWTNRINAEHRAQGRNGKPLNEIGIEQAKELKKKFENENIKFDYIYSSPQERAIQTAKISTGSDNIIIDNRLNVYDLGSADGMLMSEIKITGTVPDMSLYDGVEQLENYKKRIYSFINEITEKYKNQNINILVVGHKCTTGMLSAYFDGFVVETIYDDYLKLASKNCEYKKYII